MALPIIQHMARRTYEGNKTKHLSAVRWLDYIVSCCSFVTTEGCFHLVRCFVCTTVASGGRGWPRSNSDTCRRTSCNTPLILSSYPGVHILLRLKTCDTNRPSYSTNGFSWWFFSGAHVAIHIVEWLSCWMVGLVGLLDGGGIRSTAVCGGCMKYINYCIVLVWTNICLLYTSPSPRD